MYTANLLINIDEGSFTVLQSSGCVPAVNSINCNPLKKFV